MLTGARHTNFAITHEALSGDAFVYGLLPRSRALFINWFKICTSLAYKSHAIRAKKLLVSEKCRRNCSGEKRKGWQANLFICRFQLAGWLAGWQSPSKVLDSASYSSNISPPVPDGCQTNANSCRASLFPSHSPRGVQGGKSGLKLRPRS